METHRQLKIICWRLCHLITRTISITKASCLDNTHCVRLGRSTREARDQTGAILTWATDPLDCILLGSDCGDIIAENSPTCGIVGKEGVSERGDDKCNFPLSKFLPLSIVDFIAKYHPLLESINYSFVSPSQFLRFVVWGLPLLLVTILLAGFLAS